MTWFVLSCLDRRLLKNPLRTDAWCRLRSLINVTGFARDGITTGIWIGAPDRERMEAVSGRMVLALIFLHYNRNLHERLRA